MTAVADWPHLYTPGTGPVLLMLHGTGSSEHDIAPLGSLLRPDAAILAPRGRSLENGATRWFRRVAEGLFDVDDVEQRADELAGFVRTAIDAYGLAGREVIVVGLSNGANVGTALAIRHPQLVRRVVAFSGMYPFGDRDLTDPLAGSTFVLLNGASDPMAPAASVSRLVEQLGRQGASVAVHSRVGGHGIAPEDLVAARAAITG